MIRRDGSVQSANLPSKNNLMSERENVDHDMYRGMVVEVFFTDNNDNLTFDNKQVTYDVLILGGTKEGTIIPNCKLANFLGGQYNYHERVLRKAENPFNGNTKRRLSEQKGDIVYVLFVGKTSNPVIIGLGTHPLDKTTTGATLSDGPIWVQEFNGINTKIDKNGNYELVKKGGVFNSDKGYFVPADRSTEEENGEATAETFQARVKFSGGIMLWEDPKSSITLDKTNQTYKLLIGEKNVSLFMDGVNDSIKLLTQGTAELNLDKGKVALGASGTELLQKISDQLQELITLFTAVSIHTHLGNLGYPTDEPDTRLDWEDAATNLTTIKDDIDGIKGVL